MSAMTNRVAYSKTVPAARKPPPLAVARMSREPASVGGRPFASICPVARTTLPVPGWRPALGVPRFVRSVQRWSDLLAPGDGRRGCVRALGPRRGLGLHAGPGRFRGPACPRGLDGWRNSGLHRDAGIGLGPGPGGLGLGGRGLGGLGLGARGRSRRLGLPLVARILRADNGQTSSDPLGLRAPDERRIGELTNGAHEVELR